MLHVFLRAEADGRVSPRDELLEHLEVLAAPSAVTGREYQQRKLRGGNARHVQRQRVLVEDDRVGELTRRCGMRLRSAMRTRTAQRGDERNREVQLSAAV